MSIETYFDVKRKIRANFDEEQPKIFVQTVEIVMRHKHIPTTIIKPDPLPLFFATSGIAAGFLLCFANQHYATALFKLRQMSARRFVFFFSMRKVDNRQTLFLCKLFH